MINLLVVKLIFEGTCSDTNCWITERGGGWIINREIQSFLTKRCKCYINVSLSSNSCRVNKQWTTEQSYTYTIHQCFYVEIQSGRKPQNDFSYMFLRITFIGSTNFLCFPAATRMRLQPPSFSGYNLRKDPTPQFSGYNQKEARTPYVLRLQLEGGYNHLSFLCPATLK